MSDFDTELRGKAYALVNSVIDLEEFSSWFRLAILTAPALPSTAAAAPEPFIPPPRTERFTDYARDIDEPDEETRAHHKRMLGSGSED
jgi:hypothetical protein